MPFEVDWIKCHANNRGLITQAAKALGLSRQGLHNKLAKYGIREG